MTAKGKNRKSAKTTASARRRARVDVLHHCPLRCWGKPVQPINRSAVTNLLHRRIPGRLVCGIHVVPDPCYPYDSDPKTAFYPEQGFRPRGVNNLYRDRRVNAHSLHCFRGQDRPGRAAAALLCLAGPYCFRNTTSAIQAPFIFNELAFLGFIIRQVVIFL